MCKKDEYNHSSPSDFTTTVIKTEEQMEPGLREDAQKCSLSSPDRALPHILSRSRKQTHATQRRHLSAATARINRV